MNRNTLAIICGLALVLIAALFLQQTVFKPSGEQAGPQVQEKTVGSSCDVGEKAGFNCQNAKTLYFLDCENGAMAKKTVECAGSAVCKTDSTGAACVQDITFLLAGGGKPAATATPTPKPTTQPAQKWIYEGFCGDGICSTKENCASCVSDCTCAAKEFCDTRYGAICRPMDSCGDGLCSNNENKNKNCCQDCGCASGTFCPTDNGICIKPLVISTNDIRTALSALFPDGFNALYEGDYAAGGETFKEIVLTDSIGVMHFVYLNSSGQVAFEVAST